MKILFVIFTFFSMQAHAALVETSSFSGEEAQKAYNAMSDVEEQKDEENALPFTERYVKGGNLIICSKTIKNDGNYEEYFCRLFSEIDADGVSN